VAITGVDIETMGTYSTVDSSIVLTPGVSFVTFTITVFVEASETNTSGTLVFTNLPSGMNLVGSSPNTAKLTANGLQPYANVTFKIASSVPTLEFDVKPTLDVDGATLSPQNYHKPIVWLEAGVLFPSFTTTSQQPGDLMALDTSVKHTSATVKVNVTDSSLAPVPAMKLRFGAANREVINRYQYEDLSGNGLTLIANGIPSTDGDAIEVTTDASGQAGFTISIPDSDYDSLAAQAQVVSWGAQLLGDDSTFFRGTDPIFIGPLQGVALAANGSPAAPEIEDADGSLTYSPQSNVTTALMDLTAWGNISSSDNVLVIVGDEDSPSSRPRQLLKVHECVGGAEYPQKGDTLIYTLDTDRLVTGNCPLRYLAFKSGLSSVTYSYTSPYQVGTLPPQQPPTVNRPMPIPRLFVKEVDDSANPIVGGEILSDSKATITWDDIKFGGIYVFIPYSVTDGANGMNGSATVKIYRTGIYQGQATVSTVPKLYPMVQVSDTAPTPSGHNLPHGALMLIPIEDLRYWNAPNDGLPGRFYVEYWNSNSMYSQTWKGYIDTVPIGQ
jgi:hypothetical protein